MKGKTNIGLIIIVAVVGILIAQQQGWINLQAVYGVSILSLSQIDYISNDPVVAGRAWSLIAVLNQMGQSIVAESPMTTLADSYDKVHATYGLKIKVEGGQQTCRYTISRTTDIFTFSDTVINFGFGGRDAAVNQCINLPNYASHTGLDCCRDLFGACFPTLPCFLDPEAYKLHCITKSKFATIGVLNTPSTLWNAKITATRSDGISDSKTITNWGAQSTWLDGNNVFVSWSGDLVSAETCPVLNLPAMAFYNGYWYAVKGGGSTTVTCGWTTINSCLATANSQTQQAIQSNPLYFYAYDNSVLGAVQVGNNIVDAGVLELKVDKLLRFPLLNFKIKADWVGVIQEVGMPDIISATGTTFTTGGQGTITAQIKNIGTATGSFNTYATCTNGIMQTGKSPDYLTLSVGEIGTQNLFVTGTSTQDTTGTCTITTEDRNNPSNKDTYTVSVTVKTICDCSGSSETCQGNARMQCDGCRWKQIEICPSNKVCKLNTAGTSYCELKPECELNSDCDDNNPNTIDKCETTITGTRYCSHTTPPPDGGGETCDERYPVSLTTPWNVFVNFWCKLMEWWNNLLISLGNAFLILIGLFVVYIIVKIWRK